MDIVEVIWDDASCVSDAACWLEGAGKHPVAPARAYGAIVKQNKKEIVLSMVIFDKFETAEDIIPTAYKVFFAIPMGAVKKIRKLGKV